jgi:hypothetical protein
MLVKNGQRASDLVIWRMLWNRMATLNQGEYFPGPARVD